MMQFKYRDRLVLVLSVIFNKITSKRLAKTYLKLFRKYDSPLGLLVRFLCIKKLCKKCGDRVAVLSDVYLLNIEGLSLGNDISIHPFCYIDAAGGIEIHDNVSIAHGTTILSTSHVYDKPNIVIKKSGLIYERTIIEEDVWVGAGVKILKGVKIEKGSIIAAGSIVNKNVQPYSIYGGIPAKPIRERFHSV